MIPKATGQPQGWHAWVSGPRVTTSRTGAPQRGQSGNGSRGESSGEFSEHMSSSA
ncbi:hypothetical protein [Haladaptatus sp. T7]|uniref:hypothetical protein n=1 Tax=Haladaptatus sp. T7 TaxID=2029368 RepID=UPI002232B4F3|nr:hypothetical protein [Haladaptatus sp. T7]